MENASATTHTYRLLPDKRASLDFTPEPVVAHELVHQWHGDMLAVRDWAHTWLKESSADYYEATWREHDLGIDEYRTEMRDYLQAYLEADARGRRPIVYNVYRKNGNELFDRHVYEKGALTLNMLRFVVGEEPFWRGVKLYTAAQPVARGHHRRSGARLRGGHRAQSGALLRAVALQSGASRVQRALLVG